MTTEQLVRIKDYVVILNEEAGKEESALLLDYVVEEVCDRVLIYLNSEVLIQNLERPIARVVSGVFNQSFNSKGSTEADSAISSISDNGQSISYSNEIKKYLASVDDDELFGGVAKLLAPYRRINVVS